MHIVVSIKMVPDTTLVKIDPVTNTLVREGVPFITNPYDTHAIEEALRVKDQYGATVTVMSMGPPAADKVLRRALSMGVDKAILLSDRVFGGADTLATSKVLAEAIARMNKDEPVDLVFCGMQTIDGDTAQVGPGIACRLNYSQLTLVDKILDLDMANKKIKVRRKLEGYYEIVESQLPAMITVVREINTPRYPTVPGRLQSDEIVVPVLSNDVLRIDKSKIGLTGSPTVVRKIFAPEREKGEIINGEEENKEKAVTMMVDKIYDWDILTED